MKIRTLAILVALVVLAFVAGTFRTTAQSGGGYDLSWNTIDGGGAAVSGGAYTLVGTMGQSDAGTVSGGAYSLAGGFWAALSATASRTGKMFLPLIAR